MNSTYAVSSHERHSKVTPIPSASRRRARPTHRQAAGLSGLEISVLFLIAAALICGVLASAQHPRSVALNRKITVQRGETLWSIAQTHPVPSQTTAQTAEQIAEHNGLHASTVAVGQKLVVHEAPLDAVVASR